MCFRRRGVTWLSVSSSISWPPGVPARQRIWSGHSRGGACARAAPSPKRCQPTPAQTAPSLYYHALSRVLDGSVPPYSLLRTGKCAVTLFCAVPDPTSIGSGYESHSGRRVWIQLLNPADQCERHGHSGRPRLLWCCARASEDPDYVRPVRVPRAQLDLSKRSPVLADNRPSPARLQSAACRRVEHHRAHVPRAAAEHFPLPPARLMAGLFRVTEPRGGIVDPLRGACRKAVQLAPARPKVGASQSQNLPVVEGRSGSEPSRVCSLAANSRHPALAPANTGRHGRGPGGRQAKLEATEL
jgi:hypothetical protein